MSQLHGGNFSSCWSPQNKKPKQTWFSTAMVVMCGVENVWVWSSPWPSLTPSHTPFSVTTWQRAASMTGPNGSTSTISISPSQSSVNTCSSNGQACRWRRVLVRVDKITYQNIYTYTWRYFCEPKLAHHLLLVTAHFDVSFLPKLAETALLFYRVTDVPFLPNMDQCNKLIGIGNRLGRESCSGYGNVNEI